MDRLLAAVGTVAFLGAVVLVAYTWHTLFG